MLRRFTNDQSMDHCKTIKKVLKYLRYTLYYDLHYIDYPIVLERYNDANWISNTMNFKSTNRYVFTIDGAVVSWKFSKQTSITGSMMGLEFISLDKAEEEAEWIQNFLKDISYWSKSMSATCFHCDNQSTIRRVQSSRLIGSLYIIDKILLNTFSWMKLFSLTM